MATATYNVTSSKTDLQGLWKKVQVGTLREAANFMFKEWDDLESFRNFDVDWSTREITAPFDFAEGTGTASIVEGGWEARPSSPTVVDASFTWIHLNKRFTVSLISRLIQQRNRAAQLIPQFEHQGKKALQAISHWIADSYYGFSTAVRAKATAAGVGTTSQVITLKDAYGVAGLGSTGSPAYVSKLFHVGDYIAAVRAGALVANSFGVITAITPNTPSITVTFAVAPTLAADDSIVYANSLENTTLEGTDYNKGLSGWLEAVSAVSLQGISSATYPAWKPGYADTTARRFTNMDIRRMRQAIANTGGGTLNYIRWSQGVANDVFDQMQASVRFNDLYDMDLDGSVRARGVDLTESRHVPPGMVFGADKASIRKMVLLPRPGRPAWDDLEKVQDRSMYVASIDYPCQMVWLNRGNLAYATNKIEL
jgi:hypothetical protein